MSATASTADPGTGWVCRGFAALFADQARTGVGWRPLPPGLFLCLVLAWLGPSAAHATGLVNATNRLTVATFNVFYGNRDLSGVATAIAATQADVVCLQETNAESERFLRGQFSMRYPHQAYHGSVGQGGFGVLSVVPLSDFRVIPPTHGLFGSWLFRAVWTDTFVEFAVVHLHPPDVDQATSLAGVMRMFERSEEIQSREIAALWQHLNPDRPLVVLGDFNGFASGPAVGFLRDRGLSDAVAARGDREGRVCTWSPPGLDGLLCLRIDHVLYSRHFRSDSVRVVPTRASDHRPLVVTLQLNPDSMTGGTTPEQR